MWWERWIPKNYLTKSTICGVECSFTDAGLEFSYSILSIKKNKVDVLLNGMTKTAGDVLGVAKKANAPIVLTVSGKGVISKKVVFNENDSLELIDLTRQYLPTISANEFYIQFYKSTQNFGYLTICRKDQVDALVRQFSENKTECVDVFIGPLICNALADMIPAYNRVTTSAYLLELSNGYVENIQNLSGNKEDLKIGDMSINSGQVLPFASGFSYLTRQQPYITNDEEIKNLSTHHHEKIKLRVLVLFMIAVIFLLSAINSVVFFQKFEENNNLEVELNLYESKNSQITQLLDSYQKKKSLIEKTGIFENKKLSLFADKIAASLPEDIVLRELSFNPQVGETEEDSLADFQENQLIIKGNCNKSLLLNEWVNVLKSQQFIKAVNLENYVFNSEGHLPNFVLKIEIK